MTAETPRAADPINYAGRERKSEAPSPIAATLLCLPGFICWCVFVGVFLRRYIPVGLRPDVGWLRIFGGPPILLCWGTAVVTAIASVLIYWRRRKPWYVWMNLTINVAGLLMSALFVVMVIRFAMRWHAQ